MISTSSVTPHGATSAASAKPTTVPSGAGGGLLPFLPKEGDTTASLLGEAESFKSQFEKSKNKGEEIPGGKESSKISSALLPFALKSKDGHKTKESKKLLSHAQAANVVPLPMTPSVPDTRSWALSLPTTPTATTTKELPKTPAATTTAATTPTDDLKSLLQSGAPDNAQEHALQRTEIAFTVTVPPGEQATAGAIKQASASAKEAEPDTKPVAQAKPLPATTAHSAPNVAKPISSENNSSSKHGSSSHSEESHSEASARDQSISASSSAPSNSPGIHSGATSLPTAAHGTEQPSSTTAAATTATVSPQQAYTAPHKMEALSTISQTSTVSENVKPLAAPKPQSIDLKVGQADGSQVDVRVSQRAGDVQVTVRTADGDLAQSLRHHLPELSDRLAQNGTPGDFWQPGSAQGSSSHFSDADTHDDHPAGGNGSHARGQEQPDTNGQSQSHDQDENGREAATWFGELTNAQTRH